MTKFKEYIIEKTNKKEFEEALSNDNILAGCEFEFYVNGDIRGEDKELRREMEDLLAKAMRETDRANIGIKNGKVPSWDTMKKYLEVTSRSVDRIGRIDHFNDKCAEWFKQGKVPYPVVDIDAFMLTHDSRGDFDPDEEDYDISKEYFEELDFPVKFTDGWSVISDASLKSDTNGVEIVTPPLKLSELVDTIEKVFKWMSKYGHTDSTCGFHVHMSINNGSELDPLKLILFAEEGLVYKYFADRVDNRYAESIKKGHFNTMGPFTIDDIKELAKKNKIDKEFNTEKYLGIHLIELKKNHVEFRYMGGDDYHKKFKEIREIIANYAHWLSIAGDPNYKRNEYITKVARLANHFNHIYIDKVITKYNRAINTYIDGISDTKKRVITTKVADSIIKPYIDKLESMPKPKNAINFTDALMGKSDAVKLFNKFKERITQLER